MVKIQPLPGLGKSVVGQTPNPDRAVGNDQGPGGLAQSAPQRFGMQLLPQPINPLARGHKSPLGNHRSSTGGLAPMIQAKTSARVDPMPAFGFLAFAAQGLGAAPIVA